MSSGLFNIAGSGARAARAGLEVTSQNIANAATEGYVRRSVRLAEVTMAGGYGRIGDTALSGVRIDGIARNADGFRTAEVRRTGSDSARAASDLTTWQNVEAALDQSGLYPAMTGFEGALQQLATDPVDPALRTAALEDARMLARTFNTAAQGLDAVATGLRFNAADGVEQVNRFATELARTNVQLTRSIPGSSDQASLLDQRDELLGKLANYTAITTSFAPDNSVEVRIGGPAGQQLVSGAITTALALTSAADGTISFTLGNAPVTLASGTLAAQAQGTALVRDTHARLDSLADDLSTLANAAQTGGAALDGTPGTALFAGSGAAGIGMALGSGAGLATAPAAQPAGSRDPGNLAALRGALASSDVAGRISGLLFDVSSATQGRKTTSDALEAIASSARLALDSQAGVNLDEEAVNLVRYQQAFQACGKAIQAAADIFDTLLAIR